MYYDGASIYAPVNNENIVPIAMTLALMTVWSVIINDVKESFLKGNLYQDK